MGGERRLDVPLATEEKTGECARRNPTGHQLVHQHPGLNLNGLVFIVKMGVGPGKIGIGMGGGRGKGFHAVTAHIDLSAEIHAQGRPHPGPFIPGQGGGIGPGVQLEAIIQPDHLGRLSGTEDSGIDLGKLQVRQHALVDPAHLGGPLDLIGRGKMVVFGHELIRGNEPIGQVGNDFQQIVSTRCYLFQQGDHLGMAGGVIDPGHPQMARQMFPKGRTQGNGKLVHRRMEGAVLHHGQHHGPANVVKALLGHIIGIDQLGHGLVHDLGHLGLAQIVGHLSKDNGDIRHRAILQPEVAHTGRQPFHFLGQGNVKQGLSVGNRRFIPGKIIGHTHAALLQGRQKEPHPLGQAGHVPVQGGQSGIQANEITVPHLGEFRVQGGKPGLEIPEASTQGRHPTVSVEQ